MPARGCAHRRLADRLPRHRRAHRDAAHRLCTGCPARTVRTVPGACEHWAACPQAHSHYHHNTKAVISKMQLTVSTATLLNELQTAARVASTRSAVQALSGIQLHADEDGSAELRATDMEVGLRLALEATVESPGEVVLPARLLLDIVRSLPGGDVRLRVRDPEGDVELVSGAATFHLRTLRNDDFPHLPTGAGGATMTLDAPAFIDT